MKTLILNGSPKKNGDTAQLLERAKVQLQGTYDVVSAYEANIHPCTDCRHCQTQLQCIFRDEMEAVYAKLKDCDRILLASPIYFSELTGSLLNVASRLQPYFYARYFRKEPLPLHIQKAVIVLVGGGTGSPERAYHTATEILRLLQIKEIYPFFCSHHTDQIPATADLDFMQTFQKAMHFLNT